MASILREKQKIKKLIKNIKDLVHKDSTIIDCRLDISLKTVLMRASELSCKDLVRIFLRIKEVEVDAQSKKGWTALMFAVTRYVQIL